MPFIKGHQYAKLKRRRKLTDTAVKEIYRSKALYEDLETEYGVSKSTISMIKRGHRKQLVLGVKANPPRYLRGIRLQLHLINQSLPCTSGPACGTILPPDQEYVS